MNDIAHANLQQALGAGHPYTCSNCRDNHGIYFRFTENHGLAGYGDIVSVPMLEIDKWRDLGYKILIHDWPLVMTKDGWLCPTCGYKQ